jgi:anaerobic magnesium-protoporphyrin IX monomethyl ester cyclase
MAKIILTGGPSFALFNPSLHVSLGLLYLGAALRQAGHDVKIVDCHKMTAWDEERGKLIILKELLEPCDILGVSCVTPNAEFGGRLAEAWPAKVKVAGGPHVSYIINGPHKQFKHRKFFQGFDYLMTGECEDSFVEFCNAWDRWCGSFDGSVSFFNMWLDKIPGVGWFREDGTVGSNPPPPLPDVVKMPLPAYDLWDGEWGKGGLIVQSQHGKSVDVAERTIGSLWTARGCPYGCYFCADARTKLREETLPQVEAEVKWLAEHGITSLRVWDDVITIKYKHCRDLADIFWNYGMLWRGWSRVNLMNPDLFKYLASHGCTEMGFGVEHGSPRMLKAMNKGTTPEANTIGIKICQDAGIVARSYLLIGFPGETWESIHEMQEWLDVTRPDAASLHMFQPYPGSQVWVTPERFGIKELPEDSFSRMWELNDDDPKTLVLELDTMTKDELFQARTQLGTWIKDNISMRPANR